MEVRSLRASGAQQGELIGREAEMQRFRGVLARIAAERAGAAVLVCADPGMGKTRLAEEFLATAANLGLRCHSAIVLDFGATQGRDAIHQLYASLAGIGVDTRRRIGAAHWTGRRERRIHVADKAFAADLLAIPQQPGSRYEAMDNEARTEGKLRALSPSSSGRARGRPSCCWSRTSNGHRRGSLRACASWRHVPGACHAYSC